MDAQPIAVDGDSDGPVFVGLNGQWVPLTTVHEYDVVGGTGDGPSLSSNLTAVNASLTNGKFATLPLNLLPEGSDGGYFRRDIVAATTPQGTPSLQQVVAPQNRDRIDFCDSGVTLYSYEFYLGDGTPTMGVQYVRDDGNTGAWYLCQSTIRPALRWTLLAWLSRLMCTPTVAPRSWARAPPSTPISRACSLRHGGRRSHRGGGGGSARRGDARA